MTSPDWTNISTIATTVAIVMSGFLWFASKIFNLGKTSHRLDTIEADLSQFKQESQSETRAVRDEIRAVRTNLNQRMDKLIFTIAESYGKH